jgi:cell filamentation protein
MSDAYKFLDPDYTYTDPKTGVLRNLVNIEDEEVLLFAESGAVTKRVQERYENPIKLKDTTSLFVIHKHLFQDIYAWAGTKRVVEIGKAGKQFFPTGHFENAFRYIDTLILEYKGIRKTDKQALAQKLAEILDHVNYLHPFREGNGRTQREFISVTRVGERINTKPEPA